MFFALIVVPSCPRLTPFSFPLFSSPAHVDPSLDPSTKQTGYARTYTRRRQTHDNDDNNNNDTIVCPDKHTTENEPKPGVSDEDNVQRVRLAPGHRCMVKRNNVYRLKNPSLKHTAVVYWATPRLREHKMYTIILLACAPPPQLTSRDPDFVVISHREV